LVVIAVALVEVLGSVQALVVWVAIAGFIAAGLDRPISAMRRRWKLPRVAGTTLVLGSAVLAIVAVVMIGGPSITNSTQAIAEDAPTTVRSMESLPIVGRLLERNGAPEKVEEFINSVPDRLRDSEVVDRVARAAGDGLVGAFWTVSIMLAVLWDGPRLATAVRMRVPLDKRQRTVRFGRAAYTAVSNVVAAAAFVAALNGTVVMTLAIVLGVPLAPILGLCAASWNFIPQVGGFIGAVPLVALSFGQGPWRGLIALVVFAIYQTFENHVIQPVVGSRAVHLPPLIVMIGALFGGVIAGFVGALVAGPTLGVAKIAPDEFRHDSERIEDRIDHR
jgi:predicted PurR-regulated permease PerM